MSHNLPEPDQSLILTKHEFEQLRRLGYGLDGIRALCEEASEDVRRVASVLEPIHDKFTDILWQIECRNEKPESGEGGAA